MQLCEGTTSPWIQCPWRRLARGFDAEIARCRRRKGEPHICVLVKTAGWVYSNWSGFANAVYGSVRLRRAGGTYGQVNGIGAKIVFGDFDFGNTNIEVAATRTIETENADIKGLVAISWIAEILDAAITKQLCEGTTGSWIQCPLRGLTRNFDAKIAWFGRSKGEPHICVLVKTAGGVYSNWSWFAGGANGSVRLWSTSYSYY